MVLLQTLTMGGNDVAMNSAQWIREDSTMDRKKGAQRVGQSDGQTFPYSGIYWVFSLLRNTQQYIKSTY